MGYNHLSALKFKNGEITFCCYDSVSDNLFSKTLLMPQQAILSNFEFVDLEGKCICGNLEPVSIYTSYSSGFYMNGSACKRCNYVIGDSEASETIRWKDYEDDWAAIVPELLKLRGKKINIPNHQVVVAHRISKCGRYISMPGIEIKILITDETKATKISKNRKS